MAMKIHRSNHDAPALPQAQMPTDPESMERFRVQQERARDMLRGDLSPEQEELFLREHLVFADAHKVFRWARANAVWPAIFGLACCAIEMMSFQAPRYDLARFGYENMRASPRQADLLILSGRVTLKMGPVIRRLYDQMLEPKWVIAMGACSSSGGVFNNYATIAGADKFVPIDVHVPGCPPRPEALIFGILKLRSKILGEPELGWRQQYGAEGTEELA
jgi:NADH-quinone oxidoreductase subunit B